ncbi:hypothetical protein ACIOGT_36580 [Streptomyces microflavus]|uniref:hypothetical protein n=1 Tax=Streptomyces microflavus TaxID=1919 RepID=UPI00380231B8
MLLAPVRQPEFADADEDQKLVLQDLTTDQVRDWRVRAMKDHQIVFDHIDSYGELSAGASVEPGHDGFRPRMPADRDSAAQEWN